MWVAIGIVVGWFCLTGSFLAVMKAAQLRAAGTLTRFWRINTYPWLALGVLLDCAFNVVGGTLLFVELPHELMFSSRVSRWYNADRPSWRRELADWWAGQLNAVAPGHIH